METKQKMAVAGSGLVVVGIGLGIVGAALVLTGGGHVDDRAGLKKGRNRLTAKVEGASKTVGTIAGTLHRSFNEAKRAGIAEMKRNRSDERAAAS